MSSLDGTSQPTRPKVVAADMQHAMSPVGFDHLREEGSEA
jgi:hypothetical protein